MSKIIKNEELNNKTNIKSNKQDKIFTIQKYQNSNRFGDYVKKTIGIKQSSTQLEKLTPKQLDNILNKIRVHLDNKNMDSIYNNMAKTMAFGIEMGVSPFYDIYGFSDTLLGNEQFLDCYEKFKIEHKLPQIPTGLQLCYIITSTMILQHNLNKYNNPQKQTDIKIDDEVVKKLDEVLKSVDKIEEKTNKHKPKIDVKPIKNGDII